MSPRTLARAHGAFNLASGVWPLVHLRSFEAVLGPKEDEWLVHTVAGLLVAVGLTQLATPDSSNARRQGRVLGIGVAATLAAVDLVYVPRRRIRPVYLLDAAAQLGWIAAWVRRR